MFQASIGVSELKQSLIIIIMAKCIIKRNIIFISFIKNVYIFIQAWGSI